LFGLPALGSVALTTNDAAFGDAMMVPPVPSPAPWMVRFLPLIVTCST
jgi:hypothetical protein